MEQSINHEHGAQQCWSCRERAWNRSWLAGPAALSAMLKVTVLEIKNGQRETGLRGGCLCPRPSFRGVGTDP